MHKRKRLSQRDLVAHLKLSKSRISFLCKNLCDLNLIERCGKIATDDNEISNDRAVQLLQLKRARFYSLLVINTVFE